MSKKRILIFASGRGSNAEAIYKATIEDKINGVVVGVICDHKEAFVIKRASMWKVPVTIIEKKILLTKWILMKHLL